MDSMSMSMGTSTATASPADATSTVMTPQMSGMDHGSGSSCKIEVSVPPAIQKLPEL